MSGEQTLRPVVRAPRSAERRAEAESAIAQALIVLETRTPSVDQLSDLADAIDSLKEGAFDIAADLAVVAQASRTVAAARRPASMAKTLPDLKAAFEATRRFLRATPLKRAS